MAYCIMLSRGTDTPTADPAANHTPMSMSFGGASSPPPPLRSLFLDMNSFFASCEQQMNPALRGKAIAVVPMLTDSTCVIAASYPAKRYGIKTGTRVGDARRMCPGIQLITGNHEHYIRIHHEVINAIDTVLPVHAICSVDEFECRLWGKEREPQAALELARRLKLAILKRAGECMTCSIGLAPNRVLAKVGSDMQKPDGLVMLAGPELRHRLASLVLRDMPGIGPRMERRLNRVGIATMEDLLSRTEKELVEAFESVHGSYWWHWLRGHEIAETKARTRSIGHQHVLPPEERNLADARAVLVRLLHKAAARLRQKGYVAKSLHVFVRCMNDQPGGRWGGRAGWEKTVDLGVPTDDTVNLLRAFAAAWAEAEGTSGSNCRSGELVAKRLLMVGITLIDLEPVYGTTMSLFQDSISTNRPGQKLGGVMDVVNKMFGKRAIYPASMHTAKRSAPMRIAFSSIPDPKLPE